LIEASNSYADLYFDYSYLILLKLMTEKGLLITSMQKLIR